MAYPSGCDTLQYNWNENFAITPQHGFPTCTPPPPACTLEITSTSSTAVTIRGGEDGTVTANWSGSTGTTTVHINGTDTDTTAADTYTFTGLTSGYYTVLIEEGTCFSQVENIFVNEGSFRTGDFVTTEPADLVASNNPIPFTVRTAVNSGAARPSKSYFEVDQDVFDGYTIRIQLEYPQIIDVTLTAKAFPNRDEYFLATDTTDAAGTPVTTNTKEEVAQSLGAAIEKNTELNRLYTVLVNGVYVYLTARENNQKLDLTTDTVTMGGGRIELHPQQGGQAAYDGSLTENYSIYADIYMQPNATYGLTPNLVDMTKVAQLELPFQQNNIHRFNLAPVISNYVSTPKLDWNLSGFTTIVPALGAFRVLYGEKYPLVPNTNTKKSRYKGTGDLHYVLNSSLEWEEINDMDDYLGQRLHNIKADFEGDINRLTSTSVEIDVNDYLIDTGSTATTDIMFRFTRDQGSGTPTDSGWQTGNTQTISSISSYSAGDIFISGTSSGVIVEYQKEWWAYPQYYVGSIEGYNRDANIQNNVKFLTDTPQVKTMQRDGSDWLFILLPRDYGRSLKVKADLYFYDGTEILGQDLYDVFTGSSNAGGVFMFGSGYEQLGLEAYELSGGTSRKIRRVDFALYQNDATNGDYPFSEVRSYRYEIDEQVSTFEVAFQNRLGFYDTFTFIGEIVDNVERTTGKYEVPLNVNSDGSLPRGFQKNTVYNTRTTKTIKANSGWLEEDHRDWLVDSLLSSNRIYEITQGDENYVTIKSVQESSKSSNNSLHQLNVTFELTTYENNVNV